MNWRISLARSLCRQPPRATSPPDQLPGSQTPPQEHMESLSRSFRCRMVPRARTWCSCAASMARRSRTMLRPRIANKPSRATRPYIKGHLTRWAHGRRLHGSFHPYHHLLATPRPYRLSRTNPRQRENALRQRGSPRQRRLLFRPRPSCSPRHLLRPMPRDPLAQCVTKLPRATRAPIRGQTQSRCRASFGATTWEMARPWWPRIRLPPKLRLQGRHRLISKQKHQMSRKNSRLKLPGRQSRVHWLGLSQQGPWLCPKCQPANQLGPLRFHSLLWLIRILHRPRC